MFFNFSPDGWLDSLTTVWAVVEPMLKVVGATKGIVFGYRYLRRRLLRKRRKGR